MGSSRERSPITKKIWLPIHLRSFDSHTTIISTESLQIWRYRNPYYYYYYYYTSSHQPACPSASQENQCEMLHFSASVGAACKLIFHIHVVDNIEAVKTKYLLTCITWLYCGLRCRSIEVMCFFKIYCWQVFSFNW